MARNKSKVFGALVPPLVVLGGILALWENEGRFNYHKAAGAAQVVSSGREGATADTIALTAELQTDLPITGQYIEQFRGYLVVRRSAEIYSWKERHDDDRTIWEEGWYGSLDNNSRNRDFQQTLLSATLYPPRYELGDLAIHPTRIHFVDHYVPLGLGDLPLTRDGLRHSLEKRGGFLYKARGRNAAPQLGDERVSYEGITTAPTASYFGRIVGESGVGKQFQIKKSAVSDLIGNDGILHHLVKGGREEALQKIEGHFQKLKWMVRAGGTLAVMFGIYAFFSAFVNLLYRIPLLGNLVSTGVLLVSAVLGLGISLFVILSSLFVHNPLLVALPAILVVAGIVVFVRRSNTARRNVQLTLAEIIEARRASEAAPGPAEHTIEDTFLNLSKLALSEGGLGPREQRYLTRWGAKSGIGKDRMKALFARAKQEGGPLTATHRDDMRLLACLAMADGVLSTRELAHLLAKGKQVGMSASEVRALVLNVQSGTPAMT